MSEKSSSSSSGIGLLGLLTCIFVTLKLLGKIDWSWWWVVSPSLISMSIVALVFVIALIVQYMTD
jgi:hypothetical protein